MPRSVLRCHGAWESGPGPAQGPVAIALDACSQFTSGTKLGTGLSQHMNRQHLPRRRAKASRRRRRRGPGGRLVSGLPTVHRPCGPMGENPGGHPENPIPPARGSPEGPRARVLWRGTGAAQAPENQYGSTCRARKPKPRAAKESRAQRQGTDTPTASEPSAWVPAAPSPSGATARRACAIVA
jgi:hypothetical protein